MPSGLREPVHLHEWGVRVSVAAGKLDSMGLVMDFHRLEAVIDNITGRLSGTQIEQTGVLGVANASAENVAGHIFQQIEGRLPSGVRLEWVEVTEARGCGARYDGPDGLET